MSVKTGIPGMDELTDGGFPEGTINLISGPAGSAKTLFGLQYIFTGFTEHGEKGLFISLEESRDNLTRASKSFGMDYDQFMGTDNIQLIDFGEIRKEIELQEVSDNRNCLTAASPPMVEPKQVWSTDARGRGEFSVNLNAQLCRFGRKPCLSVRLGYD